MPVPVLLISIAVVGSSILLSAISHVPVAPAWITGLTLGLTGLVWMALPQRLRMGELSLVFVLGVGLAMRLIYFSSEPILEIDYFRYLWDAGAVHAGLNPFAVGPADAIAGRVGSEWTALVAQSGDVAEGISYGNLATIYPPIAQAAFWIAYQLDPWGITGLRIVFVAAELLGLWFLISILKHLGRAPSWIAIYWWNPLIAKELINSAHMDALLLPALAGALLLAIKARPILSGTALAVAAGIKVWPLVLAPLFIWQGRWRVWFTAGLVVVLVTGLIAVPMILGRLDNQSGLVAYAGRWERNHALFGAIREVLAFSLYKADMLHIDPNRLIRLIIGFVLGITAIILGWRIAETKQIPTAALIVSAMLLLLSPTAFPWYYVWVLPFLCIVPVRGLLLLGVLLPFYYLRFDMERWGNAHLFDQYIVWLEFGPVFALLAYDWIRRHRPV